MKYFNLLGVICLAALCGVQWNRDRLLNLRLLVSEHTIVGQADVIGNREARIKNNEADLNELRDRLEKTAKGRDEAEAKLATGTAAVVQLTAERDQLKSSVNSWMAAVAERDKALKQAGEQIQTTASERNAAIEKFNDLASKYNGVVKDLNAAREKLAGH